MKIIYEYEILSDFRKENDILLNSIFENYMKLNDNKASIKYLIYIYNGNYIDNLNDI